jgi:hypothetical protein
MPKRAKHESNRATAVKDLVTVAFAEDMDLAREYQQLLSEKEIPAVIRRQPEMAQNGFSDIAIQVPESLLDEAHALISEQASYDDFFDMMFDHDDNETTDVFDRLDDFFDGEADDF